MSRRKKMQAPEDDEPGLDISSLIDVCFLLLIYFLVTTTIVKKEQDLDMALPSVAPSTTPPDIDPMFIRLEANGYISVRSEGGSENLVESDPDSRALPELYKMLETYKNAADLSNSEPLVQLFVEADARQQRVIDILNTLAALDISKVTFTDLIDPED
jgi:biopolymer transport protein ExbD